MSTFVDLGWSCSLRPVCVERCHTVLTRTVLWYVQYYGTYSIMVRTVLWYVQYYGTYSIMVHTVLWYVQYYGTYSIMVHTVLWYVQYYGTYSIMVRTVLWYVQYCGTYSIMVRTYDYSFTWKASVYPSVQLYSIDCIALAQCSHKMPPTCPYQIAFSNVSIAQGY